MVEDDETEKCVVWKTPAEYQGSSGDYVDLRSDRTGGSYRVTNSAKTILKFASKYPEKYRVLLTNWLVEQRRQGNLKPTINSEILEVIKSSVNFQVTERVDRLVIWFSDNIPGLGQNLPIGTYFPDYTDKIFLNKLMESLCAFTGSASQHEALELLEHRMVNCIHILPP
jgi:hypothetical protein